VKATVTLSLNRCNCEKYWRWRISRRIYWMRVVNIQKTTKILGRCSRQSSRDLNPAGLRCKPAWNLTIMRTVCSCRRKCVGLMQLTLQSTLTACAFTSKTVLPTACIWVFCLILIWNIYYAPNSINRLVFFIQNTVFSPWDWNWVLHFETPYLWMVCKTVSFYGEE
jgi:hypothetical protein